MTRRAGPRGLGALDPRTVPLPNGTEVTTRVEKPLGDRVVPHGAVGRVVATVSDEVDVQVVGVGVVRYRRDEVLARKAGQVRFAQRREAAWTALRPCVVLEATVGSRAWGVAEEGSDHDVRGAFVLPFPWTTGLGEPPGELVSGDGSSTYWEAGKLVRQALKADPNTLELLFVDGARALDEPGAWILEARDAFVSLEIYGSFGRYALSQLKRLEQSKRLYEHRAIVLDWLRKEPELALDRLAGRLAAATGQAGADGTARAKDYVKQLYRSMYDQGLLEASELAAMARFAREAQAAFELPRELRPKNAYNLLRLIATAIDWLRSGRPALRVEGALRDRLLGIKRGEVPLDEVLREAEAMTPALEAARANSPVPRRPDLARADALLRRIRAEAARRWADGGPGPFGAEAPPPPEIAWEDER